MTIADIVLLMLVASIVTYVFTLGLQASIDDAFYLFRHPALLLRAIFSMNVVMVIIAVIAAAIFNLAPPVQIAIIALAVSPIPPLLPKKQLKSGASDAYTIGLLVAAILLSIIIVPLSIELIGRYFHADLHVPLAKLAPPVFIMALLPLFLGILVHRLWPNLAERIARPIALLSTILLVAGALPILFTMWGPIWNVISGGGILALILFTVIGLGVGYALGGPDSDNRTALALATSARHPAIALTIAGLNFPEHKPAVMALILCHLLVGTVAFMVINAISKRRHADDAVNAPMSSGRNQG